MPDQKVSSIFSWWNTSLDPIRGKNNTWKIGQRIVEEEQQGKTRAEYGKGQLQELARILTLEFGHGFDARRLRDYRQFYLYFPDGEIWHARVPNLTWTHFRSYWKYLKNKLKQENPQLVSAANQLKLTA
ncbi:MAG: DUF1016 domain-containing protein [Lentisphaerae bacterium]|nr:DUF1016 domain-containing protein [Lentisphaerota bacterium]